MHITQASIEIEVIKNYRVRFKAENKRGSLNSYIQKNGGLNRVLRVFCGVSGFCNALKEAGYERTYIYRVKRKFNQHIY